MHELLTTTRTHISRETLALALHTIDDLYEEGVGRHHMWLSYGGLANLNEAITSLEDAERRLLALPEDVRAGAEVAGWCELVGVALNEARLDRAEES
jgi:hypothetical protein